MSKALVQAANRPRVWMTDFRLGGGMNDPALRELLALILDDDAWALSPGDLGGEIERDDDYD